MKKALTVYCDTFSLSQRCSSDFKIRWYVSLPCLMSRVSWHILYFTFPCSSMYFNVLQHPKTLVNGKKKHFKINCVKNNLLQQSCSKF